MEKLFISYRRADAAWPARAIFERLSAIFPGHVFLDLDTLEPGADFVQALDRHLDGCSAMLVIIGPRWSQLLQDHELLDLPDFVKLEVSRALQRNITVVPVLVDDAPMPKSDELNPDVAGLLRRSGLVLHVDAFDAQMSRLAALVQGLLQANLPGAGEGGVAPRPDPGIVKT